jgi:hypothetical protein
MFIPFPDPDFLPSRTISNKKKERVGGKFVCSTFFVSINFKKLKIILFLKRFKNIFNPETQKYGFGIRDPEKTHPESRGQKSTGSGSATLFSAIFLSIGDKEHEHTLLDINNNGPVRFG